MPKIVITEKYSDSFKPQIADLRLALPTKKCTFKTDPLGEFCRKVNLECTDFRPRHETIEEAPIHAKVQLQDSAARFMQLSGLFTKSVNEVLHEISPWDFPSKNSKLSNFKLSNVLSLRKEKSQNILQMLKNSVSDEIQRRNQISGSLQKSRLNMAKVKRKLEMIKKHLKQEVIAKNHAEGKIPGWKEITKEFYATSNPGNPPEQEEPKPLELKKTEGRDHINAIRLLAMYEGVWKNQKDFSIRKVCRITPLVAAKESPINALRK